MVQRITLEEAYQGLDGLLERVNRGEEVAIEREGTPVGILISPARYQLIREAARQRLGEMIRDPAESPSDIDPDEAEQLAVDVVEEIRAERRSSARSGSRASGP